jgi:hypothetical protein
MEYNIIRRWVEPLPAICMVGIYGRRDEFDFCRKEKKEIGHTRRGLPHE